MPHTTTLILLAACLLSTALGCFTEPEKPDPVCFSDGELTLRSPGPDTQFCCDIAQDEADGQCRARLEDANVNAAVLGECIPDGRGGGVCQIDCNEDNCQCINNNDCSGGTVCQTQSGQDCTDQGLDANGCTLCANPDQG